jgi:hypothetical protein
MSLDKRSVPIKVVARRAYRLPWKMRIDLLLAAIDACPLLMILMNFFVNDGLVENELIESDLIAN